MPLLYMEASMSQDYLVYLQVIKLKFVKKKICGFELLVHASCVAVGPTEPKSHGSATLVLEYYCPGTFGCTPAPTHLNQIMGFNR